MKRLRRFVLVTLSAIVVVVGIGILQAGGWEDFKLRHFALAQIFHDQSQELDDLRKQNVNPEEATRIDGHHQRRSQSLSLQHHELA